MALLVACLRVGWPRWHEPAASGWQRGPHCDRGRAQWQRAGRSLALIMRRHRRWSTRRRSTRNVRSRRLRSGRRLRRAWWSELRLRHHGLRRCRHSWFSRSWRRARGSPGHPQESEHLVVGALYHRWRNVVSRNRWPRCMCRRIQAYTGLAGCCEHGRRHQRVHCLSGRTRRELRPRWRRTSRLRLGIAASRLTALFGDGRGLNVGCHEPLVAKALWWLSREPCALRRVGWCPSALRRVGW